MIFFLSVRDKINADNVCVCVCVCGGNRNVSGRGGVLIVLCTYGIAGILTALAKFFYSTEYLCNNVKVAGLDEIFVGQKFTAIIIILFCCLPHPLYTVLMPYIVT